MTNFISPTPCGVRKDAIDQFADEFASSIGLQPGGALEPIVQKLGGTIEYQSYAELENSASGSIVIRGEGDFTIYLPDYTSPARDRFSIAHEIGHYVLHFPLTKQPMKAARYGSDRAEWEANWFAAGLIMPAKAFKDAGIAVGWDPEILAGRFKVSLSAAEIRVRNLSGPIV